MAEYSQKWHNGISSRIRSNETSDGLAAIQAQLNNLGREIKKVNEKVYAAQKKLTIHSSVHPINLEDNIEQRGQDSTNEIMETLPIINQWASTKTLEIQIGKMSKVFQERGFESLPSFTEANPQDQVKSILTAKDDFSEIRHIGCGIYAVSRTQHKSILSETVPFPRRLQNFGCDDWREAQDVKILDAYDHTLPQKEKDPESFTLPCFIHNICFGKALVDLGASVSVMPFSTYTNLGLGILSHTRLTIELADRTIKQPRGIAENVLVRIGKFIFPINFIILDIPEDDDVPLILGRPFLSTAYSKIDVFKKKITLKLIGEGDEPFDPTYGNYIELNDLNTPLEPKTNRDVDFEPTFVKIDSYKMKFSCLIGYKYVNADLLPSLPINLMSKSFYYSIIKDNDERKSHAGTLIDIPVFVRSFSIITGFTIINGDDITKDVVLGMKFCKKYASYQMIMRKFAHWDGCERIEDE
ncbi:ribonuclease H-like domain-containing protein [Tanacetum coccineum]